MPWTYFLVTLTACSLGCSEGDKVELGSVSGVVTMDGEPLADAIIVFVPEKGNPSSGRTDEEGNYDLVYLGNSRGAIVGNHTIKITTRESNELDEEMDSDTDLSNVKMSDTTDIDTPPPESDGDVTQRSVVTSTQKGKYEPIPARYNSQTELTKNVSAGENTIDFELNSE
ncbi:MAG TPA: carboxypeptidase regulatory-like domain-containing protein [Planctomycetaceae bacterium]|nr:TonB-dependent receptor [Gimesia sp.]HAH44696.1 carboxypeptidase regulatory-like domain-containing protein [Planctomycetaceae bacterium]HBL47150.1 carboxypeptidase regulatory-like domain-containing protein [Planctomycetaceae bacterium]|tara:strand:+ start:9481 stop:9990 length:510 start_codon:yes stop_codon:yes gene_type:complete